MDSNFSAAHSPRSDNRIRSTRSSNGLQLQDISHLPIVYPSSRSPTLRQRQSSLYGPADVEENNIVDVEDGDDDDDDEWEVEHEYVNVGAGDTASWYAGGAPVRPHPVHRESQDVEFGNRLTTMRSLRGRGGRPWDVNVRLPHSLARGKTALLKTLRGGLRRVHVGGLGHHVYAHARSHSNGSPPFEFRDPQPAPQSIRQQYAELAPPEPPASQTQETAPQPQPEMRTQNGLLAPPATIHGSSTSPDHRASQAAADARRHSRSQSASYHSQARPTSGRALRPRSRSVGSRHSRRSAASAETTTVIPHNSQMHDQADEDGVDTAETTLVQHVNDIKLTLIQLSPSESPESSRNSIQPHRSQDLRFPRPLSVVRARDHHMRVGRYSKPKASLLRALHALQRLPWIAAPENPRGFLIPEETPRITKDFVPSRSSRAKLRATPPGTGMVYKKKGISAEELDNGEEENRSWYRPGTKQVQRAVRAQHYQNERRARAGMLAAGAGGGLRTSIAQPVKQAYASYRAASKNGRPLDYMYAPSPSRSLNNSGSAGAAVRAASLYSARQYSGGTRANEGAVLYGVDGRPGSIAAAASAYLVRSASASQANSATPGSRRSAVEYPGSAGTATNASVAPPVPPKSSGQGHQQTYPETQQQQQQQQPGYAYAYQGTQPAAYYTYNFAYPQNQAYAQRVPGSSPPLPPVPAATTSTLSYASAPPSGYGHGHGEKPVRVQRSASASVSGNGSIPTIPTVPSTSAASASSYSYTRPHGHGHGYRHDYGRHHAKRNGSSNGSGNATSRYGTVAQPQLSMRQPEYAYAYVH